MLESDVYWDTEALTGLDVTLVAGSIGKNSMIKIEAWDKDTISSDDLMLRTEGTVESFLQLNIRRDTYTANNNKIVTYSTWNE